MALEKGYLHRVPDGHAEHFPRGQKLQPGGARRLRAVRPREAATGGRGTIGEGGCRGCRVASFRFLLRHAGGAGIHVFFIVVLRVVNHVLSF